LLQRFQRSNILRVRFVLVCIHCELRLVPISCFEQYRASLNALLGHSCLAGPGPLALPFCFVCFSGLSVS
jgi:hypothetical protein